MPTHTNLYRRKSGSAKREFTVSANTAYSEVKLEPLGAGVYEDPDKIVKSINTESCQLAEQSAADVIQPAVRARL